MIAELRVRSGWIDAMPEVVQQLFITDLGWIVGDLYSFGMNGPAFRHLFIARVFHMPSGKPRDGINDARQLVKIRFHAPETAAGEGGNLVVAAIRQVAPGCLHGLSRAECQQSVYEC